MAGRNTITLITIIAITLWYSAAIGQPGPGGGGLEINQIYNKQMQPIDVLHDTMLRLRFFDQGASGYNEFFIWPQPSFSAGRDRLTLMSHTQRTGKYPLQSDTPVVRMCIYYGEDTMVVDFSNIIGRNMALWVDYIDTLVIQKGYFKCRRYGPEWNARDERTTALRSGLTPHTLRKLTETGDIVYEPRVIPFSMHEEMLGAGYFLDRAEAHLKYSRPKECIADVHTAEKRGNGSNECEGPLLLSAAYASLDQTDSAIRYVSEAINAGCDLYSYHRFVGYPREKYPRLKNDKGDKYYMRIPLWIKKGAMKSALLDYDSAVLLSADKLKALADRAEYKMNYLHDPKDAINDLKELIRLAPAHKEACRMPDWNYIANAYLDLGVAEYAAGNKKEAIHHWLMAADDAHSSIKRSLFVLFDSMIIRERSIGELYLGRAICRYQDQCDVGCQKAIMNDVDTAVLYGVKSYQVYLNRCYMYSLQKKYEEALSELNKALQIYPDNPWLYRQRATVKWQMGDKSGNKADYDIYMRLCPTHPFEK